MSDSCQCHNCCGCGCLEEIAPEPAALPSPDSFFELLHKTPVNTVCPNFYLLDHARGCNFDCSYCFLRDPEYHNKRRHVFTDSPRILAELRDWVGTDSLEAYLANTGNMADSLTFEKTRPLWAEMIEIMREHAEMRGRPHTLLVVTKAGRESCGAFFAAKPCKNIIVSFSVNCPDAARDHESGAATPAERLAAARELQTRGWRVRIRLDPMILGYDYSWVIDEIKTLRPERLTLGTLRADPSLLPVVSGLDIFHSLVELEEGAIWRYPLADRLQLYRQAVDRLAKTTSIGLCEETPEVWRALGLDVDNKTCNCNPA